MSKLHQFFVLLTLAVVASVADARSPQKIVGGTEASPTEFPYQVSLKRNGIHFCGGSIIGKRYIVTAAHCIVGVVRAPYTDFTVTTGSIFSSKGQSHVVESVVAHPGYTKLADNDIAIVKLAKDIKFDQHQNKINLPTEPAKSGKNAVATGWGLESHHHRQGVEKLLKVNLNTLEHNTCQKYATQFRLSPSQICTHHGPGRGVCMGDSGGPLAHNNELIGIVSYGQPCARGVPDVFTNVHYFLDWIKKHATTS